jgi:hypothetical protein
LLKQGVTLAFPIIRSGKSLVQNGDSQNRFATVDAMRNENKRGTRSMARQWAQAQRFNPPFAAMALPIP